MRTTDRERLLSDVLESDEAYQAARTEMLAAVLSEVRGQRRRGARARRVLALAACVPAAVAVWFWSKSSGPLPVPQERSVVVVRSQSLHPEEIVRTGEAPPGSPLAHKVSVVRSGASPVELVHTGETTEEVTDQQLLDMFGGEPVVLVTVSPRERRLILPGSHGREAPQEPAP